MDCCAHEGPDGGDARFDIQQVADGVHVAVAAPAYKVNCNTAIIETDDGLIVVDTHSKPSAARVIVDHLRDLSPQPVRYVVNTHFHWDHWHGNEVYPKAYPGAEIVTNQITREAMVRKGLKRIQDQGRRPPGPVRAAPPRDRARRGRGAGGAHPTRRAAAPGAGLPRRGHGARARAAHHRLRRHDEAVPARPGNPSPAPRPRAHGGRRLRVSAE